MREGPVPGRPRGVLQGYTHHKGQPRAHTWNPHGTLSLRCPRAQWRHGGHLPPDMARLSPALGSSPLLHGSAGTLRGPWATPQTGDRHYKAHRKSPEASREKSSQEGSRAESSDKWYMRKLESTVATQFNDGFTNREAGGPEARMTHSPPQGQVLRLQGSSEAVKTGQRSRLNNSGSAHGLLPCSFDFYKLTIQASGEHENTTTQVRPSLASAASPQDPSLGLPQGGWPWPPYCPPGLLRKHSLAKYTPAQRKGPEPLNTNAKQH